MCLHKFLHLLTDCPQFALIISKQNEIIAVSKIALHMKSLLDEIIQLPQIEIAKPLRCQIPDRRILSARKTIYYQIQHT